MKLNKLFAIILPALLLVGCNKNGEKPKTEDVVRYDFSNTLNAVKVKDHLNDFISIFTVNENSYLDSTNINDGVFFDEGGIRFGTSSTNGEAKLTFTKPIKHMELIVAPHTKITDQYQGVDNNAKVRINEYDSGLLDISYSEVCKTEINTDINSTYVLDIFNKYPIEQSEIDNKTYGRFVIFEMTLTFDLLD